MSPEIHTVTFRPPASDSWLPAARHRDLRLDMAGAIADVVGLLDGSGLLVFPAGFLRAPSMEAADALAASMRKLSQRSELALLFGVDIGGDEGFAPLAAPPQSHAFACEAGRPLLWPATQSKRDSPAEQRCLRVGGVQLGLVIGAEVFNGALRRELERSRPEAIVVLTHVGPTDRWRSALEGLRAIAPVILVGDALSEEEPPWTEPPLGWQHTLAGGSPGATLHRYAKLDASDLRRGRAARAASR